MGLFENIFEANPLVRTFGGQSYDFPGMANQRMAHGLEPIDWPKIIVNQFRSLAQTRPLTMMEQFAYDGASKALNAQE